MAMTPQEQQRMEKLERMVMAMYRLEDIPFIENIKRRCLGTAIEDALNELTLDDLADVVITSPTSGQVIKRSGSNWVNGTDNV